MTISRCGETNVSAGKEIQAAGDESSEQNEEKVEYSTVIVRGEEDGKPEDITPDGGLIAWLQVLGSFALYFNTWCVKTQQRLSENQITN